MKCNRLLQILRRCCFHNCEFCTMSCLEPASKKKKVNKMDKTSEDHPNIPSLLELEEMCMSPDPFADSPHHVGDGDQRDELEKNVIKNDELQEVLSTNVFHGDTSAVKSEHGGGESSNADLLESEFIPWKGCPLTDIQKGFFGVSQLSIIKPSSNHAVLFQVGPSKKESTNTNTDAWDSDHVRMPCSSHNRYPVGDTVKSRWDIINTALRKPIKSCKELEAAIKSYNHTYAHRWDFSGLHHFFNEVIEEEEAQCFFSVLLPQMVELALQLPALITRPLPLLRQHQTQSISLTQQQVACLLANAFFCTYPRRNASKQASEYSTFPDINFNRLFQGQKRKSQVQRTNEKLKCIFHYFRRVCHSRPIGNITFTRRYISNANFPIWERSGHFFRKLHISSKGTIEDYGRGMLQVDFANKMVGGGVLGWGCVQEEIRFVICPELIVARLFTECLDSTEALLITGCEQYSTHEGYADNFTWNGDYQDETPRDTCGRRLCSVVAMDALYFRYPSQQFTVNNLTRELNKAFVGFYNPEVPPQNISAVATGNWGCGVYRGNTRLKALLQLMAAAQAGRALAYFTFGDTQLRDDVIQMHGFLVCNRATVGLVWRHLCKYYEQCFRNGTFLVDLYEYLYKSMDPTGNAKSNTAKGRSRTVSSPPKMKIACPVLSVPVNTLLVSPVKLSQNEEKPELPPTEDSQESSGKVYCINDYKDSSGNVSSMKDSQDTSRKVSSMKDTQCSSGKDTSVTDTQCASGKDTPPKDSQDSPKNISSAVGSLKKDLSIDKIETNTNKPNTSKANVGASKNIFKKVPSTQPVSSQVKLRPNPLNVMWDSKSAPNRSEMSSARLRVSSSRFKPKSPAAVTPIVKNVADSSKAEEEDWKNHYEKQEPLTIQKRISEYFYEINVPK